MTQKIFYTPDTLESLKVTSLKLVEVKTFFRTGSIIYDEQKFPLISRLGQ